MTKLQSLGVVLGDELGQIKFLRVRDVASLPDETDLESQSPARASAPALQAPLKAIYKLNARLAVHDIVTCNPLDNPRNTSSNSIRLLASRGWKKGGAGVINDVEYSHRNRSSGDIRGEEHVLDGLQSPMRFFKVGDSSAGAVVAAYDVEGNISAVPGWSRSRSTKAFAVKGPVSAAVGVMNSVNFAFGGRENDLQVCDFSTQQEVFKARNVPHDKLDMRVPVWITGIASLPSSDSVIATCTGYAQVRVYDIRAQRRPVKDLRLADWSHMTGIVSVDENNVVVSDTQGHVSKLNLQTMRLEAKYKGFAGGVRSLDVHPDAPFLLAGGLDRRVHIHHLKTRKVFADVYVKQKLNVVRFCTQLDLSDGDKLKHKRALEESTSEREAKKAKDISEAIESDSQLDSDDEVDSLQYTSSSEDDGEDGLDWDSDAELDD